MHRLVLLLIILVAAGFFVWFFLRIVIYILISVILGILGQPIVEFLNRQPIGRFRIPRGVCAFVTLILMIGILLFATTVFLPLLARQAALVSDMGTQGLMEGLEEPLKELERLFMQWNILDPHETISGTVVKEIMGIFTFDRLTMLFSSVINLVAEIFIGFLAISFITFFALKDKHLFSDVIVYFTPVHYKQEARNILAESKLLVRRYFAGLIIRIVLVFILTFLSIWMLGIKGALVIAFFSGVLSIIPYLGPIIATFIGVFIGASMNLGMDFYTQMLPLMVQIVLVFIVVNIIDVVVLQPVIYSKSVWAHPLEIFLVFMVAAIIGGIFGMIIAIPAYSVIRIFLKVFMEKSYLALKIREELKI